MSEPGSERHNKGGGGGKKKRGKKSKQARQDNVRKITVSSWKQSDRDVTFVLDTPQKVSAAELDTAFEAVQVTVTLKGNLKWQCKFYEPIQKEDSNVAIQGNKVVIRVIKATPGCQWATLEAGDVIAEVKDAPTLSPSDPSEGKIQADMKEKDDKTIETPVPPSEEKPQPDESASVSETVSSPEGPDQQDEPEAEPEDSEDNIYELSHIKHSWFEKSQEMLVIHIYVKNVKKDTLNVTFQERTVTVKFNTKDTKFIELNKGSTADSVFLWRIELYDAISAVKSKVKVTGTTVEIQLVKKQPRKWLALEPLHSSTDTPTTPSDAWIPATVETASVSSPTTKKIMFDEMNDEQVNKRKNNLKIGDDSSPVQPSTSNQYDNSAQKPTCMVSPLALNKGLADRPSVVRPGMTGLDNLGNTCFMNSVLQVLANTVELRDYFLEARFQKEINQDNVLGTGGKLAVAFAILLRVLWSGKHYSFAPSKLKNLVAQKASQFTGFAQHDAQEFMAFLLDGLHEDVNRIHEKPYTQTVDSDGRPDEEVAKEAWRVHLSRNDSFIVDIFQGQYKSKLVCPVCRKVSITFDPFSIVPVPLPKKQRLLPIVFMSKDPYKKPLKYTLRLPRDVTTEQLKEAVSQRTGVKPRDLRVFESYRHGIHQFFSKSSTLTNVTSTDLIIVSEVLSEELAGESVVELTVLQRLQVPSTMPSKCSYCRRECQEGVKLRRCTRCYRTAYCDQSCQKHDWQRHSTMCRRNPELVGVPFYISVPESQATYSRLAQMIQAFSRYSIDIFQPPVGEKDSAFSSSENSNSNPSSTYSSSQETSSFSFTQAASSTESPSFTSGCASLGLDQAPCTATHTAPCTSTMVSPETSGAPCTSTSPDSDSDVPPCTSTSAATSTNVPSHTATQVASDTDVPSHTAVFTSDTEILPSTSLSNLPDIPSLTCMESTGFLSDTDTIPLSVDSTIPAQCDLPTDPAPVDLDVVDSTGLASALPDDTNTPQTVASLTEAENSTLQEMDEKTPLIAPQCDLDLDKDTDTREEKTASPLKEEAVSSNHLDSQADDHCVPMATASTSALPTQFVTGRQQDGPNKYQLPFHIRPVDHEGRSIMDGPLEDLDDQPLDLSSVYFLAVEWKNNEKCRPYVMVQSKTLEIEDDDGMMTAPAEESNEISLQHCLSLFTEPEVLSPEHAWYCPRCKEHREATKQLSIWKLPQTLIIQLKRFSFRNLLWRDKIDKLVSFPTRGLDMSPYFIGNQPTDEPPPIYDLYGVVNHHGGILGGHYTSFVRCPDPNGLEKDELGWRLCDDSMVSNTSEKQVVTRAAYLLFYRRRQPTSQHPIETAVEATEDLHHEDDELELDENCPSIQDVELLNDGGGDAPSSAPLSCLDTDDNIPTVIPLSYTDMDTVD